MFSTRVGNENFGFFFFKDLYKNISGIIWKSIMYING